MQLDRNEGFLALIDVIGSSLFTLGFRDRDRAGLPLFYYTILAKGETGLGLFYSTLFYSFFRIIYSTMLFFSYF